MRYLTATLTFILMVGCATQVPRYREVTLLDNGNYAVSDQSIDAFKSQREVEQRARQYCSQQQLDYRKIDEQNSYVNGAGEPLHRVTLYFQCQGSDAVAVAPRATSAPPTAAAATTSAALVAAGSVALTDADTDDADLDRREVASEPVVGEAPLTIAATAGTEGAKHAPEPPFREVTALGDDRYGITRQSLEPFQSSRAVQAKAQQYCGERQQQVEELDRQMRYVNSSGNEQAHRVTLFFRCHSQAALAGAERPPQPPFQDVTALGDGRYGVTRQSLEPFKSDRAVLAQAQRYCAERQQQVEEIDRSHSYLNRSSNEPAHKTTLYFRCLP